MPALSNAVLFRKLRAALPAGTVFHTPDLAIHPAEFTSPGIGRVRAYLYTVTPDRSAAGARPAGEFKIQLIVDGQIRPARGSLNMDGAYPVLLGYSPDFGVFVGWEARLYSHFAYSANVQVREPLLIEARNHGWAVAAPRRLRESTEVRVAFAAGNMLSFLRASKEADKDELTNQWREAFFLSRAPHYDASKLPSRGKDLDVFVERERQRLNASRLSRDSRFAPRVKEQFNYSCALCGVQLEIVEASHIIPVNDVRSSDDIWNGLSLCPNHHTLYDARRFVVEPTLRVSIDDEALSFLRESGRASGIELLTEYAGRQIHPPNFWGDSKKLQGQMQEALSYNSSLAAIA